MHIFSLREKPNPAFLTIIRIHYRNTEHTEFFPASREGIGL
jgi:hypothetical protein